MTGEMVDQLAAGERALAAGEWEDARQAFEAALTIEQSTAAFDGLGRALWWLNDAPGAIAKRERAYSGYRKAGDAERAASIALWLAREYTAVWGNEAAANGWLARAERILEELDERCAERGWLELTRAERASSPPEREARARDAHAAGQSFADADLELRALSVLGLAEVELGLVDEGLGRLDEAMAGATGGEAAFETLADVSCRLLLACELAADEERARQWMRVVDSFAREHDQATLLSFCRICCADACSVSGDLPGAERELLESLRELPATGQRSRCVHPATRLARLRLLQGRLEEADELLAGHEASADALPTAVAVRIARGEVEAAAALLERRLGEIGRDNLLAVPLLAQLVDARLAQPDLEAARAAAADLSLVAERGLPDRASAVALLAEGRVARAQGRGDAQDLLAAAETSFTRLQMPLEAARARLDLAEALPSSSRAVAIDLARRSQATFERFGAERLADAAAALLRELGVPGRTGPKGFGELSKREVEVIRLVAEGLTNAEIAGRLFISSRTAEHHVSSILTKLGVRSRSEAAAQASRYLDPLEPAS
jgi:DNA-binding CsgD family transcriptional regulator